MGIESTTVITLGDRWRNRDKSKSLPKISTREYETIKEEYAVHFSPRKKIVVVSGYMYFRLSE